MDKTVEIIVLIALGIVGLCIGSFLNVLIYRLPLGMNIAVPPSHCPSCEQKIKWYDNIPLLSYVILRGKCRNCKSKIPFTYFAVELINVALWIILLITFDLPYSLIFALASSILIAIAFIDFKHQIIPDSLNITIAVLGLIATVYGIFYPTVTGVLGAYAVYWWERLIGCVGGGLLFTAVYFIYLALRKKEGLGGGDIKFIAAAGLLLGYKLTLLCIGLAAIYACIYLLIAKIAGKLDTQKPFAFGPFLAAAAFTAISVGNYFIDLYLSLF